MFLLSVIAFMIGSAASANAQVTVTPTIANPPAGVALNAPYTCSLKTTVSGLNGNQSIFYRMVTTRITRPDATKISASSPSIGSVTEAATQVGTYKWTESYGVIVFDSSTGNDTKYQNTYTGSFVVR